MRKGYSLVALLLLGTAIILNMAACNKGPQSKKNLNLVHTASRNFPGEFDKQQAIWMMWPSSIYNQNSKPVNPVLINVVKAITSHTPVRLMASSDAEAEQIKALLSTNGIHRTNVYIHIISHSSIWTRDVGPIFVRNGDNSLSVVNFGFNNYSRDGNSDYINSEGQVDKMTAQALGLPIINTTLVSEGGAVESNGQGTIMLTEAVALKRNPGMTKQQIENEYKRVLGVSKVIWLKKGLAEDDKITSGHINEIARFASPNTILLGQVLPADRNANQITQSSYQRLEENYRILTKAMDQDGKPFHIIRIPMPPAIYGRPNDTGNIPVLSYLNYVVTNGAVIAQFYWKPGLPQPLKRAEEQVKATFQKVYPGREIIGIDAENVNRWGGGLHCITQHMPAR